MCQFVWNYYDSQFLPLLHHDVTNYATIEILNMQQELVAIQKRERERERESERASWPWLVAAEEPRKSSW